MSLHLHHTWATGSSDNVLGFCLSPITVLMLPGNWQHLADVCEYSTGSSGSRLWTGIRSKSFLHSYCWCKAWKVSQIFTTWHSVMLSHTADGGVVASKSGISVLYDQEAISLQTLCTWVCVQVLCPVQTQLNTHNTSVPTAALLCNMYNIYN